MIGQISTISIDLMATETEKFSVIVGKDLCSQDIPANDSAASDLSTEVLEMMIYEHFSLTGVYLPSKKYCARCSCRWV